MREEKRELKMAWETPKLEELTLMCTASGEVAFGESVADSGTPS